MGSRRISRRDFLRLVIAGLTAGLSLPVYSHWVEPAWIEITHLRIPLPGLDAAFHGFRLVHVSDLHMDETWGTSRRLAHWVQRILSLRPDAVVITGDWVSGMTGVVSLQESVAELSRLRAPEGVFTVLGNHDHWAAAWQVRRSLERAGIRELRNQGHLWQRGRARLALVGVDDAWERQADWAAAREAVPPGVPAILLLHEPDFADQVAEMGVFSLQLSGHSHGGQVKLPGLGPLILPPYGAKYPEGRYQVGSLTLYTNRGLGMIMPQVRLFCPPEITVIELVAEP